MVALLGSVVNNYIINVNSWIQIISALIKLRYCVLNLIWIEIGLIVGWKYSRQKATTAWFFRSVIFFISKIKF
jgi:hypothetical protein